MDAPPPGRRESARFALNLPRLGRLALVAVCVSAAWVERAAAEPLFAAPFLSNDAGIWPACVAIGDLNRDGHPDLATVDQWGTRVCVMLGNGDGTFQSRVDHATGMQPCSVAIGDLNGDGRPDLVVANAGSSTVSVLLGDGEGGFGTQTEYAAGDSSISVAIGDLNGDGRPDLAVADARSDSVSVLLGNGDGSFGARTAFACGRQPSSVAIADLNGDGRLDLAVADAGATTVSILLGSGDGTFGARTDFASGDGPCSVAIADLNGDGRPDLVTANANSNTVSVLLGDGAGGFGAAHDFGCGTYPHAVAIGDLNGDGEPDLAVALWASVAFLFGQGGGAFGAPVPFIPSEPGTYGTGNLYSSRATFISVGDLDGDGRLDVAVTGTDGQDWEYYGSADVLLGNGDGTFGTRKEIREEIWTMTNAVSVVDLDGDGNLDLVAAGEEGMDTSSISTRLGDGHGGFGARRVFAVPGWTEAGMAAGDLTGDGKLDLVRLAHTQNIPVDTVSVLPGNGDGTFGPSTSWAIGHEPIWVAISDLNVDGKADVVVVSHPDPDATANRYKVYVLLGQPGGLIPLAAAFIDDGWLHPLSAALGDLNGDGIPDLALAGYGRGEVLLGRGDGSFGAPITFELEGSSYSLALGDVNGDGKVDLVSGNVDDVTVSLGLGDGTLGPNVHYATEPYPRWLVIRDFDGDRKPDLAMNAIPSISVLPGRGDGTFGSRVDFGAGFGPMAAGDLDGDGRPDLVTAVYRGFWVLMNNPTGTVDVAASLVSALAQPGLVRLTWNVSSPAMVKVYRGTPGGAWSALGQVLPDGTGFARFEDRAVEAGQRYGYRLGITEGGHESFAGETWVDVPAVVRFALEGLRPNPSAGPLVVALSLPSAAPARLEMLDVSGRRVLERTVSGGPGALQVRLEPTARVRPGLYFLRLSQGREVKVTRACVVQ